MYNKWIWQVSNWIQFREKEREREKVISNLIPNKIKLTKKKKGFRSRSGKEEQKRTESSAQILEEDETRTEGEGSDAGPECRIACGGAGRVGSHPLLQLDIHGQVHRCRCHRRPFQTQKQARFVSLQRWHQNRFYRTLSSVIRQVQFLYRWWMIAKWISNESTPTIGYNDSW